MANLQPTDTNGEDLRQSLTQSEQRYRLLVETVPHGIQECDREGLITFSNPAHAKMLGYEEGELVGKRIWEVLDKESEQDELREYLAFLVASQPPPTPYFSENRTKDGQTIDVQVDWTYQRDETGNVTGFISVITDITKRKRAEETLKQAHDELERRVEKRTAELTKKTAQLQAIFDVIPDLVFILNNENRIIQFQSGRLDDLYLSPDQFLGKRMRDVLPDAIGCQFDSAIKKAHHTKKTVAIEYTLTIQDEEKWFRARLLPYAGGDIVVVAEDISERRDAEQALVQSEKRLRDILNGLFGFVGLYTPDGILVEINRAPLEAAALKEEEVIGQPFWETYWWSYSREVQDQLKESLQLAARGETVRYDVSVRVADDQFIEIDVTFGPLFDSQGNVVQLLGFSVDITERKRTEAALRKSEQRFRSIFDTEPECVKIVKPDCTLVTMNPAGLAMIEAESLETVKGKSLLPMVDEVFRDDFKNFHHHVYESGESGTMEFRITGRKGTCRWLETHAVALRDSQGKTTEILCVTRDITERKQTEKELRQLREKLFHVTRLSTMGEMATGLAHELNQPLAAIANYSYAGKQSLAALESPAPEHLQELFEKMTGQAMRAGEIIRRLRALVLKRTSVRSQVDIVEPIEEVLHVLDSDLRQSELNVEMQTDRSGGVVLIDEIQIQQVLVNLIRNALEAMEDTQREERMLKITTSQTADNMIEVAVRDTGKGVPLEETGRVFDAFFSTKPEGMGMGLAISRTIIEAHQGRLWMTPNSDRGMTFHFTLPLAVEENDEE